MMSCHSLMSTFKQQDNTSLLSNIQTAKNNLFAWTLTRLYGNHTVHRLMKTSKAIWQHPDIKQGQSLTTYWGNSGCIFHADSSSDKFCHLSNEHCISPFCSIYYTLRINLQAYDYICRLRLRIIAKLRFLECHTTEPSSTHQNVT